MLSVAGTGSGRDGRTRGRPYVRMRRKDWVGVLFLRFVDSRGMKIALSVISAKKKLCVEHVFMSIMDALCLSISQKRLYLK